MPHSSRHARGTAYVDASSGIVAWKAVSKTATCGTPGSARLASSIAASAGALCSGASSVSSSSARSHVVVDHDRLAEARAAVHDAMRDGVDVARRLLDRVDRPRVLRLVDDARASGSSSRR